MLAFWQDPPPDGGAAWSSAKAAEPELLKSFAPDVDCSNVNIPAFFIEVAA
jgi:hypothetical protein